MTGVEEEEKDEDTRGRKHMDKVKYMEIKQAEPE